MARLFEKIPNHIAIIMDGNGRWAENRNLPRVSGHRQGAKTVKEITEECQSLGVKELTLYAFSQENWERPITEITYLWRLLQRYLIDERKTIMKNNIRFLAIGQIHRLPPSVLKELRKTIEISTNNTALILRLALSYGGRDEIIDAVNHLLRNKRKSHLKRINEDVFRKYLYDSEMPDPDLLIRTGGESRISNFLLWQVVYTELYWTKVPWPEFSRKDLHKAIRDYGLRKRKFGKIP
jgi:undecaprenyl diphosphate synthase